MNRPAFNLGGWSGEQGRARAIVVSDLPYQRRALGHLVETLDGCVAESLTLGDMCGGWAGRTGDLVLFDARKADADTAAQALRCIVGAERNGVAIVSLALIDLAVEIVGEGPIEIVVAPDRATLIGAIALALALARPATGLSDNSRDAMLPQLRRLSEEVERIARALADLARDDPEQGLAPPPAPAVIAAPTTRWRGEARAVDAAQVRAMIRARRLRDQYFGEGLFADPAWDMLLDLMAARLERRQVAVSSLCIAAAVPPTTALRWIKTLTLQGLLGRVADPEDGRRIFMELTRKAEDGMRSYLGAVQRLGTMPV